MGGRCLEATTTRRVIVCLRVCIVRLRRAPVALWRAPCLASPPHDAPARRVGTWDRKQEAGVARRGGAFVMSYHAMPCHARGVLYPTHRYLRNQPTSHVSPVKSTYLLPSYLTMFDALPTRCGCYSPALFVVMGVIDRDARAVA